MWKTSFVLLPVLLLLLLHAGAGETEAVNVWSGREQTVPGGGGSWTLTAAHGRVLASGEGAVTLNLPALEPGTSVDAELSVNGRKSRLRIWSPAILPPIGGDAPKLAKLFQELHGAKGSGTRILATGFFPEKDDDGADIVLVFPDRRAFPLSLSGEWDEISLRRGTIPGTLGIVLDRKLRTAGTDGDWSCIVLRNGKRKVIVFSPGFDFSAVDNILLIRALTAAANQSVSGY